MNTVPQIIVPYLERIAPGMLLAAAVLWLTRSEPRLRVFLYLFCFILLRDAMTPAGLWSFGSQGWFWIRLSPNPLLLAIFGFSCLLGSLALYFMDRANRDWVVWWRGPWLMGGLVGLGGAIVIVTPLALLYQRIDVRLRGGATDELHLVAVLWFALCGNLLEELLFRGYVLGFFASRMPRLRAGLASGVVFALGHSFLAGTVTSVGCPLLLFTLWEGAVAGLVAAKHGVIGSTITHGGAIFLLASAWL